MDALGGKQVLERTTFGKIAHPSAPETQPALQTFGLEVLRLLVLTCGT